MYSRSAKGGEKGDPNRNPWLAKMTDMLLHVFARHSVQATEHSRPCFLQLQRFESQFVLHLQYIVFRSSSGAGGNSI